MDDPGDGSNSDEDDLLASPPPPDALAVARRALILSGVVCRGMMESYEDEDDRTLTLKELPEWLDKLGLWPYVETQEEKILRAPYGKLKRRFQISATWRIEGLSILCWAMRLLDFPPHDRKALHAPIVEAVAFLSDDAVELLTSPKLRSVVQIEACREWFYDVHVSLRGFLFHGGDGNLATWIGQYVNTLGLSRESVVIEGGLVFEGSPLSGADRARLEEWEAVICERHRAAMWLAGTDEPYTEISVDT
jgi:Domain of unknown function (DUF4272)